MNGSFSVYMLDIEDIYLVNKPASARSLTVEEYLAGNTQVVKQSITKKDPFRRSIDVDVGVHREVPLKYSFNISPNKMISQG